MSSFDEPASRMDAETQIGFLQVGLGLLIGIPAAIAAGHLMASELFGVSTWSPMVLGMTTLVLAGVALTASAAPAHRAATVEPMEALRGE